MNEFDLAVSHMVQKLKFVVQIHLKNKEQTIPMVQGIMEEFQRFDIYEPFMNLMNLFC